MRGLTVVTAPATEPITTAEAKSYLRLDTSDDDTLIGDLITSARQALEIDLRRTLVSTTFDEYWDSWPDVIRPAQPPLVSVTSVKYYDDDGALQTIDSANYRVDVASVPGRITRIATFEWPALQSERENAIVVRHVSGYGAAAAVPQAIKLMIRWLVAHAYEMREPVVTGTIVAEVPQHIGRMVTRYRNTWREGE